jgi:hypothetical protein
VRDVADVEIPVGRLVDERPLPGDVGGRLAAGHVHVEAPHAHRARLRVHVVGGDHVAGAGIGVAARAVAVEEDALVAGLEIDDAVVDFGPGILAGFLLDHEPAAGLVDLALVVVDPLLRKELELAVALVVDHAAEIRVRRAVLQRRRVDAIVAARMDLPRIAVAAEQIRARRDVEDGAQRTGTDVEALQRRLPLQADVEHVRLCGAEVPPFSRRIAVVAAWIEQGPAILHFTGALVVTEKRRPTAAGAALEAEENEHRVAAGAVVHVAPVGVSDRVQAVASATVARIGHTHALGAVRAREREAPALRQKRGELRRSHRRARGRRCRRIHEAARLRQRLVRNEREASYSERGDPARGSQGHERASKPSGRRVSTRRWPSKFTWSCERNRWCRRSASAVIAARLRATNLPLRSCL